MGSTMAREVRLAARSLRRSPGFALAAMLTMGLGVGANTAIFSVAHALLFEPLPYDDASALVSVRNRYRPEGSIGWVSAPEFWELRKAPEGFSGWTAVSPGAANLTGLPTARRIEGLWVTPGFFDLLGVRPALGRPFSPEETAPGAAPVVILSHRLWQDAYGSDPGIVGSTIELDGTARQVVGVTGTDYRALSEYVFPGRSEDYWIPLTLDPSTFNGDTVERHNLFVVTRLTTGTDPAGGERIMEDAIRRVERLYPGISNEGARDVAVRPLRDLVTGPVRASFWLLATAVGLLLVVAVVNVANLSLARTDARLPEFAARVAIGAGRKHLLWNVVAENVLIALGAAAVALVPIVLGSGLLARLVPSTVPLPDGISAGLPVVAFTVVVATLAGALAGIVAASRLAGRDVFEAIRTGSGEAAPGGRSLLRRGLVVAQVAGAVVLVSSATLLLRSLHELRSVDPGFAVDDLQLAQVAASSKSYPDGPSVRALYLRLQDEVGTIPGVESVVASWQTPLQSGMSDWPVMPERNGESEWYAADPNLVTPGYFETYGIRIVEGRGFERADTDLPVGPVILNREAVRQMWGDGPAVGRRVNLDFGDPVWREVVGVVDDIRGRGLGQEPRVQTYMTLGEGPFAGVTHLTMTTRGSLAGDALRRRVREAVANVDADIPVGEVVPFQAQVTRSLERERLLSTLLAVFSSLALALGAIGSYGLVSYSVSRRTREIGLRIALGAASARVVRLVLGQGAVLGGVGVALGVAATLFTGRLLEGFLYGISRSDPFTLVLVSAGVLLVVTTASFLPARRAARVAPTVALRND